MLSTRWRLQTNSMPKSLVSIIFFCLIALFNVEIRQPSDTAFNGRHANWAARCSGCSDLADQPCRHGLQGGRWAAPDPNHPGPGRGACSRRAGCVGRVAPLPGESKRDGPINNTVHTELSILPGIEMFHSKFALLNHHTHMQHHSSCNGELCRVNAGRRGLPAVSSGFLFHERS